MIYIEDFFPPTLPLAATTQNKAESQEMMGSKSACLQYKTNIVFLSPFRSLLMWMKPLPERKTWTSKLLDFYQLTL